MNREHIKEEIRLADDECCIVFDFGCYFPYSNPEILTFNFSLGEEKFDDYKLNHRYPNRGYQTISKKTGRKVSKLGYPYIMKLNKQGSMLLCVNVGIKDEVIHMVFPVQTHMTKEKPVCGLTMHFNFDKGKFVFRSWEKQPDGGWKGHCWYSHEPEEIGDTDIVLSVPDRISDSDIAIYSDIIEPIPQALSDLSLL